MGGASPNYRDLLKRPRVFPLFSSLCSLHNLAARGKKRLIAQRAADSPDPAYKRANLGFLRHRDRDISAAKKQPRLCPPVRLRRMLRPSNPGTTKRASDRLGLDNPGSARGPFLLGLGERMWGRHFLPLALSLGRVFPTVFFTGSAESRLWHAPQ